MNGSLLKNDEPTAKAKSLGPKARLIAGPRSARCVMLLRFQRFDHNEPAHRAFVEELDSSADLGEKGVVFAAADVEAGLYAGSALPNDDGAAWDYLSAKSLETQALRV